MDKEKGALTGVAPNKIHNNELIQVNFKDIKLS